MARIGIIGTGWGARVQVPAFQRAGLTVAAIYGRDAEKVRRVAEQNGIETAVDDWRDLVGLEGIDLVSVVAPPFQHEEMSLAVLERGRHLLCEKPTALSESGAERMFGAAMRYPERIAIIDHELRFLPSWRAARDLIQELGDIRFAEFRYISPSRGDRTRGWNWWSDSRKGGGVLGAVGSHGVDALRYFLGDVSAVQAALHTFIDRRPVPGGELRDVTSDDFAALNVRMAGGAMAVMTLSVVAGIDQATEITFHGEGGALRLVDTRLFVSTNRRDWVEQPVGSGHVEVGDSPGGSFGTGTLHLGRALRLAIDEGRREALDPAATFLDGLHQQRFLDAARRSDAGGGAWQTVDSERRDGSAPGA